MRMLRNWLKTDKRVRTAEIVADGVVIAVTRKRIKNFYLRIDRGQGRVRMSAPHRASDEEVLSVIGKRIDWIKRQQARLAAAPPHIPLKYASGETHFLLGVPLQLEVVERDCRGCSVDRNESLLVLSVRRRSRFDERERAIRAWYRSEIKRLIPPLVARWEPVMGVRVAEWNVKQMRTRWGTCNIGARRIWLSLELAKFPPECLEYVVVHEMVHLLERRHNARFHALMDRFLPDWRARKRSLAAGLALNADRAGHYKQGHADDDQDDRCT